MSDRGEAMEGRGVPDATPTYEAVSDTETPDDAPTGYKRTEVGVIPSDWHVVSLGTLCRSIIDGTHYTPRYVPFGVPFYSVENVTQNNFSDTKFISTDEHRRLSSRCKPERGDILMTRIGSLGITKILNWEVSASIYVSLALLKLRDNAEPGYVYAYSKSSQFVENVEARSLLNASPKKINMGEIAGIPIPLPPSCSEQRAIAAALSDADALIESIDRLIAKKRAIKQATMQQLLTGEIRLPGFECSWRARKLEEIGWTYGGLTGKTGRDFGRGAGRYITFLNVMENVVVDPNAVESVVLGRDEKQSCVRRGDLLFNGSSETPDEVGVCALVDRDLGSTYLNSFCFGFRRHDSAPADGLYLAYYFRSQEGRELMKVLAQGSTRFNLSKKAFLATRIPLPAKREQEAIAAVLWDMDGEIGALERRRDKAHQIKQGMMQELLTGRTRLVEPNPDAAEEIPA